MVKRFINVIIAFFVFCSVFFVYNVFAQESDVEKSRKFAGRYGWQVGEKYTDFAKINIPEIFDEVYKSYNLIQQEAGLDLKPYGGKTAVRYTFEVLNYPYDVGEKVYVNVICVKGEPVAGDVMTVSVNGFMHSLKMPKQ